MKNLNITFEDKVFEELERAKNRSGLTWENFIIWIKKENEKLKKPDRTAVI